MKRTEINHILKKARAFFEQHSFRLPEFADWDLHQWQHHRHTVDEIISRRLGWDVTDFGLGDFPNTGLLLFTLRNGSLGDLKRGKGELYAEKIMMVNVEQVTPFHFHHIKVEDIINRGGGILAIQLYQADEMGTVTDQDVTVRIDGIATTVAAGGEIQLKAGQSVRLLPTCYHQFRGLGAPVLVGEVSLVNDDDHDNFFLEKLGRFPAVEEDAPPTHLLCSDYQSFLDP